MLVGSGNCSSSEECGKLISEILSPLSLSIRETDVLGWFEWRSVIGVVLPELHAVDPTIAARELEALVCGELAARLTPEAALVPDRDPG